MTHKFLAKVKTKCIGRKERAMRILLAETMHEKKISFRGLERLTGISHSTLNDIATGKISPRLDTLEIIAEKLEVTISDLYESPYK